MQDVNRENSSDVTSEAEENGEEEFGRTTALSVPLAALRFVTRLASGIFSRGQKNLDPVHTQSNDEIVCPSPVNVCESSSQECVAIDGDNSGSKTCKNEEAIISEGSENVEVAEALCSLKNGDAPASSDNDACSLKHFDMVTDPSDHYYIGASGQVLLLPYI
jgi:ubiquitin-conjugating enzyme E2 O